MGSSSSKSLIVPLTSKLNEKDDSPYDRFSDVEETGAVRVETSITTSKRPMWKYTLAIFIAFLVFVTATGISCALEDSCKTGGPPTMNHMLNTTKTSLYLMTAINSLIGVHLTEVYSIDQLVIERAPILGVLQWIVAGLLYISIFINLAFNKWYIMAVSAVLILLWMCFVTEALRKFYIRGRSRLWKLTIPLVVAYAIAATTYVVFSAVPQLDFPYKDIGVLVAEILVVISSAGFALIIIPHTRWVIIETIVKK